MTLEQMLASYRAQRDQQIAARDAARTELTEIRDKAKAEQRSALTEAEDARVTELLAARAAADEAVKALDGKVAGVEREIAADAQIAERAAEVNQTGHRAPARVTSEPEVYRKGGQTSYFRDLWRASSRGDRDSIDRLTRNDRMAADSAEYRALTTTDGAGGEFVPPLWMMNEYVNLARAGRVAADQIGHQPLPAGTDSISLPTLATGTATAEQSSQNSAVQNTDATTSSVTAAVATIAGQQVIAQQLLDQSPINMDEVLLGDLAADGAIKTDVFVLNNNAANKRGLLNVSGVNAVTYTDASPTVPELYAKVADGIQQVHTNRYLPPDKIFMHPRRWAWFLSGLDTVGRPLVTPDATNSALAVQDGVSAQGRVGVLQGLPVFVDPNIPINLGAGTNEDRIIILRSADSILFESAPKAEAFRETYANQLSILLRWYSYVALHASRYPKSISVIAGTGLVTPSF